MAKIYDGIDTERPDLYVSRGELVNSNSKNIVTTASGTYTGVKFKTSAPALKLCAFIDAYSIGSGSSEDVFRVGRYVEMEPNEVVSFQHGEKQTVDFTYLLTKSSANSFSWRISCAQPELAARIYLSSITFKESFVKAGTGWLDSANPSNIISKVVPPLPAYSKKYFYGDFNNELLSVPANTVTYVPFNESTFRESGNFGTAITHNAAVGEFRLPLGGKYRVSFHLSSTSSQGISAQIYNPQGVVFAQGILLASGTSDDGGMTLVFDDIVTLVNGVTLRFGVTSISSVTIGGNSSYKNGSFIVEYLGA